MSLTLEQVSNVFNHQVCGGSAYQWQCFGPNARYIDFGKNESAQFGSVIFDTESKEIFLAEAYDYDNEQAWRWVNPDYEKALKKEAKKRDVDNDQAWDDVEFEYVTAEEWLEHAEEVAAADDSDPEADDSVFALSDDETIEVEWDDGDDFNDDETQDCNVELDLPNKVWLALCMEAHSQDITLNQLVNNILRERLEEIAES